MNYYNYFSEIEETFIRRRGRNLLLSPLDWALIEDWQERGVPLPIVLRSIEKIFDGVEQQPARKRNVKSLTYCRDEIEAQYADWRAAQVGKNGAETVQNTKLKSTNEKKEESPKSDLFSVDVIAAHLEKVSINLQKVQRKADGKLRETLENALSDLTKLKRDFRDAETLEKALEKLDALIDESLLKYSATDRIKTEIEKQIASYKNKMEREVYERTFDLMLLKRLREQAEIPRLSLFYL